MTTEQSNTSTQEFGDLYVDDNFLSGTKAEFLATGKFKPEWFPGVKGNHKITMDIEGDELRALWPDPLIAKLQITRDEESARGRFYAEIVFTAEEQARRNEIKHKELEESAYQVASGLAKSWISSMPDSVEDFKKQSAQNIGKQIEIFARFSKGGYSFDKKTMREFDHAVMMLCDTLIEGKVNYDQYYQDKWLRDHAEDAFNRGICLCLTGHERNDLIERFLHEFVTSKPESIPA